jgi:multidrug efflux pump subunit AcrB
MNQAFHEFGVGLIIAILMVYLILMAQFTSFIDPFIILMAIPPGLAGVVLILLVTGSTLNIMSLDGRDHDDRHRGVEQHSDRRIRRHSAQAGHVG